MNNYKACLFYLTAWLRVFDFKASVLGYDVTFKCGRYFESYLNKARVFARPGRYTTVKFDGSPYAYREFELEIAKQIDDGVPFVSFGDDMPPFEDIVDDKEWETIEF